MIIKAALLMGLGWALLLAYRGPITPRSSAVRRLALAAMLLAGAVAIIWPGLVTTLANFVGVGRGTDLVLYVLAVATLLSWVSAARRIHELESRLVMLTRHAALHTAPSESHEPNGVQPGSL